MSAESLINILKECKEKIKGSSSNDDSDICRLMEQIEELKLKQYVRSKLCTRVDDLIRDIEREDDRLDDKVKEYEDQRKERIESIKNELSDKDRITQKFDCFKDEVKHQKELMAQNEQRKQTFHQLMLTSIAELYSEIDALEA